MSLVRPRLTDYHNILLPQAQTDFAIPFLDEDIPLYVDPFLLWRSPSQQDQALHTSLVNSFNHLGYLVKQGRQKDAINLLVPSGARKGRLRRSCKITRSHIGAVFRLRSRAHYERWRRLSSSIATSPAYPTKVAPASVTVVTLDPES